MVLFNSNAQFFVIVFVNLVSADMESQETKGHAKKSFASLLKNIVDVNEKRVAAIKKLGRLQDFIMTKNSLAKVHGIDIGDTSSEDFRDQNAILTLIDMRSNVNLRLRRTYNNRKEASKNNINIIIPFNSFNVQSEHRTDQSYKAKDREGNINDKKDDYGKTYKNNDEIYKIIYGIDFKQKNRLEKYDEANNENDNDIEMHNQKDDSDPTSSENDDGKMENSNEAYDETYNRIVDVNDVTYNKIVDSNDVNRRRWKSSSCDKSASKACRRACVSAHKNVCTMYKCSRRAKRAFRKECKRSCKSQFLSGRYSDSDWESE